MHQDGARWIKRGGVALWTEVFGQREKPAVLLIVGAGAISSFYSDRFCNELVSEGYNVIRYDQRDYGYSTHFPQMTPADLANPILLKRKLPYTIQDLVEDANAILQYYGIAKAHIVGHSMGGLVAQLFAVLYPERVLTFTSISVAPASPRYVLEPIDSEVMTKLLSNQPVGNLADDLEGWLKSMKLLSGAWGYDEQAARSYIEEIYRRDQASNVAWNHIAIQQLLPDLFELFRKNRLSGLILHGEVDPLQKVAYAHAAHELISNSELVILPQLGHMWFSKESEEAILQVLLAHFLSFLEKP